jgi:DNA-binding beta-propeller fold protein YncE
MGSLTQGHGTLTKGASSTLGGQPVVAVTSSKGGTMYVATTGKPYPLEVSKNSGGQTGKVTFSDYNKSFTITAPANSINIEQLEHSG